MENEKKEMPPPYSEQQGPIGFGSAPPGGQYPHLPYQDPTVGPQPPTAPMLTQPVMQPGTPVQVVTTTAPVVVLAAPVMGHQSVRMVCPHCRSDIESSTKKDPTALAWILTGVLFLAGCVCGCCLIPLCVDDCKSVEHTCPSCRRYLGKYQKY